jgi:acetylglutamate kinase
VYNSSLNEAIFGKIDAIFARNLCFFSKTNISGSTLKMPNPEAMTNTEGLSLINLTREGSPGARYLEEFRQYDLLAVVKIGGELIANRFDLADTARGLSELQEKGLGVIPIHGGGPQIESILRQAGIPKEKDPITGDRLTRPEAAPLVKAALSEVNAELVDAINAHGGQAEGIYEDLFRAKFKDFDRFGLVGEITGVNTELINPMRHRWQTMPVVSPIGYLGRAAHNFSRGTILNINADTGATELTKAVRPKRFISLTKAGAVLHTEIEDPTLRRFKRLTEADALQLVEAGIISDGMVPKVREGFELLNSKAVERATIVSPALMLVELFTDDGAGTMLEPRAA